MTHGAGYKAWESSDGSLLYYSDDKQTIWRMPARGGPRTFVLRLAENTDSAASGYRDRMASIG